MSCSTNSTVMRRSFSADITTSISSNFLFDRDAAGRLVEQQNARRAGDRHGDIEELAHALRQCRRERMAVARDAETVRARFRLAPGVRRMQRRERLLE